MLWVWDSCLERLDGGLRVSGFLFWDCARLGGHGGGVVGFQDLAGFKVVR